MKLDPKTQYAQSSDIKSRTYLEYRKDMKRKAIAELEILDWLREKELSRGRYAYRVPKEKFERQLRSDAALDALCRIIDMKNFILDFQHHLIQLNKEKLSHLLQAVVDHNKIVKIIPKDLESFFKVCFILDGLNKVPDNASLWLVYILSYISDSLCLEDVSKIVFCLDFLYTKTVLKCNELNKFVVGVKELLQRVKECYCGDGSYRSSPRRSPLRKRGTLCFP